MSVPLTLNVQSRVLALLARAGRSFFHMMVTVNLGKLEGVRKQACDYVLVLDCSPSTADPCGDSTIMETEKEASANVIGNLDANDRIGIVAFSGEDEQQTMLELTACDEQGKVRARRALNQIRMGSGTAFAPALDHASSLFRGSEGRQKVMIFFTDGQNNQGGDPLPTANIIKESGITLYMGGLGVRNQDEKLMEQMGGDKFRGLTSAADVNAFFAGAQADAASAALTNAVLRVSPVNYAKITLLERVTRAGQPDYMPGSDNEVAVGNMASGDELKFYLQLDVNLPEGIKPGEVRSFGKVELVGDVPGMNITGQTLGRGYVKMDFVGQPVVETDPAVDEMIHIATTAREMYQYAQTGDASHLNNAQESARKTKPFSQAEAAAKLAEALKKVQAAAAANPDAAAKEARRATRSFSAAERAEMLRKAREKGAQV